MNPFGSCTKRYVNELPDAALLEHRLRRESEELHHQARHHEREQERSDIGEDDRPNGGRHRPGAHDDIARARSGSQIGC